MGLKCVWVWFMLLLMFISLEGWRSEGCFKQERFALLQLRHFFNHHYSLQDWVEGDGNSDCCQWQRVECSNTTGRVISLDLYNTRNQRSGEWYLNVSMFSPFQELEQLELSDNLIAGCVEYEGFERLSHLNNLQSLYLDGNMFNDSSILSALSQHSSLKNLSLSYNGLRELNHFNVSRLSNLEYLNLGGNNFNNSILSSLSTLSSLKELSLYDIGIEGTVDLQEWDSLSNLEILHMGGNKINKILFPKGLRKLNELYLWNVSISEGSSLLQSLDTSFPSLKTVDLSFNNFSETITTHVLPNFKNLKELSLDDTVINNNFLQIIGAMTSLKALSMNSCDLKDMKFDQVLPNFKNLKELSMDETVINNNFLQIIGAMTSLKTLLMESCDLKDMKFDQGKIPEHLAMGCLSLKFLALSNNSLEGQIFSSNFNLTNLLFLQLDSNNFTGKIPDSLSKCFLQGLYLNENNLFGMIPGWLGNMSNLVDIIMSKNHLQGPIPIELCQLENLEVFDLSENNITGSLPLCFRSPSIKRVHLWRNKLQGKLNDIALFNSSSLMTLDLGYNHFGGSIPTWIDRLSELTYLILSNNNIQGKVPKQLCQLNQLRLLDLSHNNFFGRIPNCLNIMVAPTASNFSLNALYMNAGNFSMQSMRKEDTLEFTTKSISYLYEERILTYMSGVDLSCNKLTGEIPHQIGALVGIHTLNLSHNNLTGKIPSTFSNLKQIESLDLSYNNLNGTIPSELVELNALASFSVAYNNLSGKIPWTEQFGTFEASSYKGNPLLCGQPLPKSCNAIDSPSFMPKVSIDNEEYENFIDMDIFCISFVVTYIIVLLGITTVLYINPH